MCSKLPYDVFLQICELCSSWKDVISLRKVCHSWNYFFKERGVWIYLVSSFLNRRSSPRLHHVERAISSYCATDLERAYKRWRVAEGTWEPARGHTSEVTELKQDSGCLAKALVLAPGGRWLIVFDCLVRGFCFDLDSSSPSPMSLIPAQVSSKSHILPGETDKISDKLEDNIIVEVSEPEVNPAEENLSFRAVLTYGPRYRNATVQVWQFDTHFDNATGQSSLHALKAFSWCPEYGALRCRSFFGNIIALEAPNMDVGPGIPMSVAKLLIFNWKKAKQNLDHFPLRILFTYEWVKHAQLMRDGYILISTNDEGLVLYNYASIPVYTGRRAWDRIVNLYSGIKTTLSHNVYVFASRPYYLESSSEDSDIEDDSPAGSSILGNSRGQLYEMDIEADIDIETTSMEPTWYLGAVSMVHRDAIVRDSAVQSQEILRPLRMHLGYSHAACILQGSLNLVSFWRGSQDEGDLIVKDTGITAASDARLHMDEGSGRIVICDPERNRIQVVNLVVCP